MPTCSATPAHRLGVSEAILALLFLLLVLAAYADPLFTRRTFVGRDIVPYDLPIEKAVHDAWARGEIPVWWPTISGGRPLLPNPNAGVFYPVRLLLSRLPFPLAMRIFPILHWILGGWGMLRLLRVNGGSRAAAWVGAVSYTFSGVLVSEVFYGVIHPGASLLPWSVWALARPTTRPIGRILPIALVWGLMLLAGDAFAVALALVSAALWILLEVPRPDRARRCIQGFAGLGIAVLVALPQVLATVLLAPETRRIVGGITVGEAIGFTIHPARLLEFAVPYPFGPSWSMDLSLDWGGAAFRRFFGTFFVGPIAILGLLAPIRGTAPRGAAFARWLVGISAGLALCGLLVPAAWASLPSPIPLRYPEKFMLGAALAMAFAAGIAVDSLRQGAVRRGGLFVTAAVLAAASLGAWIAPEAAARLAAAAIAAPPRVREMAGRDLPSALADGGLLWLASAGAAALLSRPGRSRLAGALVLLTAVPVVANRPIAQSFNEGAVLAPTSFARTVARRDPEGAYRTLDESIYRPASLLGPSQKDILSQNEIFRHSWFLYTHSLWGRGTVFNADLDVGDLSRIESLRRICALAATQADSGPFFASFGLRFGIRFRDQAPVAGFRPFGGDAFRAWDENPDALPHIRLVQHWREAAGSVEALTALPRLEQEQIVIETGRSASGAARPGRVHILKETPESLALTTESLDPAWLFVLRGDWSYRTVLLDGRPVPVVPAQIAFSAVAIPAGGHRIDWREEAPGLEASRWAPAAAALLLLVVGAAGRSA